jgi:hypothetical protein
VDLAHLAIGYGGGQVRLLIRLRWHWPCWLFEALGILTSFNVNLDETDVPNGILTRADACSLSSRDLGRIRDTRPVRSTRLWGYIRNVNYDREKLGTIWRKVF